MQALRQFGLAIAVSVISLGLVVGGLSLALSENVTPPPVATETLWLPTYAEFITPSLTPQILPSHTPLPSATSSMVPPTSCTPPSGWIGVLVSASDTLESLAQRYKSSTQSLTQANCLLTPSLVPGSVLYVPPVTAVQTVPAVSSSTPVPCGAPYGWVRYTVQSGDTLYHIATSYGITTTQLQQANCLGFSTVIRIGQLLWVPPVPTRTPVVTVIPTLIVPTEPLTATVLPFTETVEPTNTSVPSPTLTPLTASP
jgi:LysM repeat protein